MPTKEEYRHLRNRVSELTDEVTVLKSEMTTLRSQVSKDMKNMLAELRGHQVATARNMSR